MNSGHRFCTNSFAIIGEGSRRICYRMREPGLCAKFYRSPRQMRPGTALHARVFMRLARFNRRLNVNTQEWLYYRQLRKQLPADLLSVFPEQVEPLFSADLGWGLAESLIYNADGSPAKKVTKELAGIGDPALRLRVYRQTERLLAAFAEHGVRFYDLSNLLLQWTGDRDFRLRLADFEPRCRGVPALLTGLGWYSRLKIRRRTSRYLARLRKDVFATETDQPLPAAAGFWPLLDRSCRLLARHVGLV